MGEDQVHPSSPLQQIPAATAEHECGSFPEAEGHHNLDEGSRPSPENQIIQEKVASDSDLGSEPVVCEEMDADSNGSIQTFKDDCVIPSPLLKGISTEMFFGTDLTSALQLLGTKYNGLLKNYQEETSEIENLRANCESLGNRCLEECEPKYDSLKQKYTRECAERKRLYNELIELKGNIRVFCRCRPLSAEETSKGYTSVFHFDPSQDTELQIICPDSSRKNFKFDYVFSPVDNQEAVFAETLPVVNSVLDGYNVCIFAYGQTGTGKTFTMEGNSENRGVNYMALEALFRHSQERSSTARYEFYVSMLEVYNEKIRDLLTESSEQAAKKLDIKQAADGTQDVPGLVEAQACSTNEVWEMLKTGARNRSVGSTNANELSSRSHCLVRVTIKSENFVNGQRNKSHLWLVDLAGSERVGKIEVEGERLKESQFINKSLSALGDVISALATKNPHIPFRNSKLTHLLQSSLGGDCKTLMFAQISPSSADLGETLCSLNFASRVRGIEYGPARKQADPAESFKLKQIAEKLRQEEKEKARLTESLQLMNLKYLSRENVFKALHEKIRDAEQACRNYQQKVRDLENQLMDQKKARMQETRESTRHSRPPLAPVKTRPPLAKITNRLPPSGLRRNSITKMPALENKENAWEMDKTSNTGSNARRISLSPVVRSIPVQPKRRASIAILPSRTGKLPTVQETQRLYHTNSIYGSSQMQDPRRFMPVPRTPTVHETQRLHHTNSIYESSQMQDPRRFMPVPRTPTAASTPDGKRNFSGFSSSSSSKYSSPPLLQALWKSKFPALGSPRQRLQHVSSPGSSQMQNKLCFSVQKRVIVTSPLQPKPAGSTFFHHALRGKETVGRLGGTAQRILSKNRRRSVI